MYMYIYIGMENQGYYPIFKIWKKRLPVSLYETEEFRCKIKAIGGHWRHRSHGQTINDLPEKTGAFFRHSHSLLRGTCSHFKRAQKVWCIAQNWHKFHETNISWNGETIGFTIPNFTMADSNHQSIWLSQRASTGPRPDHLQVLSTTETMGDGGVTLSKLHQSDMEKLKTKKNRKMIYSTQEYTRFISKHKF